MQPLASDANNTQFAGAHNPDSVLAVTFFNKPIQNSFKTNEAGRPIFEDRIMVRIMTPGNALNIVETFAREEHKRRFPLQWAHFEQGRTGDQREIGTPVSQWPLLTGAQAEELKAVKFFTVEQVAGASDEQLQKLQMVVGQSPFTLRDKARAYLAAAAGTALPQAQAEELAKRDQEIADLKATVARLAAAAEEKASKPAKEKAAI